MSFFGWTVDLHRAITLCVLVFTLLVIYLHCELMKAERNINESAAVHRVGFFNVEEENEQCVADLR